jgi:surface antigen
VVYTVKAGDTVDSLASKYKADSSRIISYNDLELTGIQSGRKIVLPAGVLPDNEKPGYVAPLTTAATYSAILGSGTISVNAGNKYDYGQCTWYAFNRRVQLGLTAPGSFWGNANTWDNNARQDPRFSVSSVPHVGDVAQSDYMSYWGHVAIVEAVSPDGTQIKFSDMNNLAGWGRVGYSDWVASTYFPNYIH